MAYTGNNSWKREAGPWEPKGKMIGNMERKKRHSRGHGDRKLDMKSVSCLTLMKTSPRCGFAAGDHLHLLALYLTWSDLLILLESVCRPAFLLLLTSTFSSFWPVGSVQSVLWFHWNKSSKCIAQSSQNFGCTVQFTLLFLPWSMHPSWGCGVHPLFCLGLQKVRGMDWHAKHCTLFYLLHWNPFLVLQWLGCCGF